MVENLNKTLDEKPVETEAETQVETEVETTEVETESLNKDNVLNQDLDRDAEIQYFEELVDNEEKDLLRKDLLKTADENDIIEEENPEEITKNLGDLLENADDILKKNLMASNSYIHKQPKITADQLPTADDLIKKILVYNPNCDQDYIRRAYDLAAYQHRNQKRDSGEPYFMHPIAVAEILIDLNMDDATIAAGLVHDVVEDTDITLDDLREQFGDEMAVLVEGVTKLNKLEYNSKQQHQAENLRKMFLAMAKDIRIIIIKLADRLHNMRTLSSHRSEIRKKEIALETKEIYAPLAHRLGIYKIKWELEDLCLLYLEPEQYKALNEAINMKRAEREAYVKTLCDTLSEKLKEVGIKADINGRPKNFYSIYNKMLKQNKPLSEIYDIHAIRVIVDTVKDCYGALGVVHTQWKPIPGRFKDYIAMPKANMYQSIHTTVICPNGQPFEVQIRTHEMHRISEYGIAAHWRYKEGGSGATASSQTDQRLAWLRQMLEWQQELKDTNEFVESVKFDLFQESVFVFSPQGDVYELPYGSTPLDFAYRVHTQVGHQCVGAKIGGKIVPLDSTVKNGDIIEILTARGSSPSRDWLKIVKTSQARNKIRAYFKKEDRDGNTVQRGHDMLTKELARHTDIDQNAFLKQDKLHEIAKKFGYFSVDDMFIAISEGAITPFGVYSRVKDDMALRKGIIKEAIPEKQPEISKKPFQGKASSDKGVWVKGASDVMVNMAQCCSPLPGDEIVGYITRGRGVSVHRADCVNVKYYREKEPQRLVEVSWDRNVDEVFEVEFLVVALDCPTLAMDVINAISETKTNINELSAKVGEDKVTKIKVKIQIKNLTQLDYILSKIKRLKNVIEVKRLVNDRQED